MVVNEATSSVQAKGTKTVIAVAVAALAAGGAMAADPVLEDNVLTWNEASSSEKTSIYGVDAQNAGQPTYNAGTVNITGGTFSGSSTTSLLFAGTQNITIKDTTFSNNNDTAIFFRGHKGASNVNVAADNFKASQVWLDNVAFENNNLEFV